MGGACDERHLGGGPGEETSLPRRDQVRIFIGRVKIVFRDPPRSQRAVHGELTLATLDWIVMKFTHPVSARIIPLRGALFQKQNFGAGFFLRIEQAGSLEINPSP